ncbi:response regulator transcription factor [Herbaspirillum rubrisubalbicans]|uniref:DNA-binding response regulator n=1 Tax=Herbaspirillum rubrisubalbicans TaxID=80842 RepID=A0AAD0UAV9_9BURK|nr:response regulator transcription factor [Herbaspirillum rubrisubalbicans]ALU91344.1 two component response regulator protein [Herbaspirillum rubrisubalbicans M1]AYR26369.1 DNA-binding response regulator [Herbaspirillum rubrisubalbicans]
MKIGIISSDADTVTLVTQLAERHDTTVYTGAEGFAAACDDGAHLMVLDLDDLQRHPHAITTIVHDHRPPVRSKVRPLVLLICTPAHQHWLRNLRLAGADDFLVKPVRRQELALRLDLLLLAAQPYEAPPNIVEAAGFVVDLARLRVTHPARPDLDATLTRKEAELALLFMQHLGRPLSRAFLLERIWGNEQETPTRTIDTHVSRIRTKLGLQPSNGYQLATVYGYGYQLEKLE